MFKNRKEFLLDEASKFMTPKELEVFKRKIIEPKKREKKEFKEQECQTSLC